MPDIAAGTGNWLLQVRIILTEDSVQHGFDIASGQVRAVNPGSNITSDVHDMRLPFPETLFGRLGLVHA